MFDNICNLNFIIGKIVIIYKGFSKFKKVRVCNMKKNKFIL